MPIIPDYQTIMLPFLKLASDGQVRHISQFVGGLATQFSLSEADRAELLPSGSDRLFDNRVGWARTYLKKAGLIEAVARGKFRITTRGLQVLASNPARIDGSLLRKFPEFQEFVKQRPTNGRDTPPLLVEDSEPSNTEPERTPQETLEGAYQRLRRALAGDLLKRVGECSPAFFERLVVDLLLAMGYGGSRKDAGKAVGRSGDDGVDGIIKEDKLGLDVVYIQAKRWGRTVGRPEIQAFAGSLEGQRARKGIFITTSQFSPDAREYVTRIEKKIVLIDGEELAQFMLDHGVGVSEVTSYKVQRLDNDYFDEDK